MDNGIFIGIDGGGTHSVAVAVGPDGNVVARAEGGSLNFHNIGVEAVRTNLETMAAKLCTIADAPVQTVCAGMSALDLPANSATTALFTGGLLKNGQLDLQSDAYVALIGFTQGHPGVIVICGTGSMLLSLDAQGKQQVSGGWGYLLGDAGSGYSLAKEGLLSAIDMHEGLGPDTVLLAEALAYFGAQTPRGLIDCIYAPSFTPAQMAGFARYVLAHAAEGEAVCLGIAERNMRRLARQTAQLIVQTPEAARVGLYGGIFAHSGVARTLFTDELLSLQPQAQICSPDYPPELGAVIHLFQKRGMLNSDVLARMKSTYKEFSK